MTSKIMYLTVLKKCPQMPKALFKKGTSLKEAKAKDMLDLSIPMPTVDMEWGSKPSTHGQQLWVLSPLPRPLLQCVNSHLS